MNFTFLLIFAILCQIQEDQYLVLVFKFILRLYRVFILKFSSSLILKIFPLIFEILALGVLSYLM